MNNTFRKLTALFLSSFLIFSQTACGTDTSAGTPAEDAAAAPSAETSAQTANGYTYTTPEQLSADLSALSEDALKQLTEKKDTIIGSFGSTLEDYQAAYPKVLEWYAEENKVTEELCSSYESMLRDVYHSLSDSVAKGNENWGEDFDNSYYAFNDAHSDYQEKVDNLYSEIIADAQTAQESLLDNKVIDNTQWNDLSDESYKDYDAAQVNSWKSLDRFYGINFWSYDEVGMALYNNNTDIDGILDDVKKRVTADVEESYAQSEPEETPSSDSGTDSAAASEPLDFDSGELDPELLLNDIAGDFTCALSFVSEIDGSKRPVPEEQSYKEIYDKYEAQVKETAKTALEEFQSESAGMSDAKEIFDLAKEKLTKVAEVTREGNIKLGMFSFTTDIKNGDHLNSFMEWSWDLQDVYIEEAYKITEAFEEKTGL